MSTDTLTAPPPGETAEAQAPVLPASEAAAPDPGNQIVDPPPQLDPAAAREQVKAIREADSSSPDSTQISPDQVKAEPPQEKPAAESKSADQKAVPTANKSDSKPAAESEVPPQPAATPNRLMSLLGLPFRILGAVLAIIDLPFAFLGPTVKNLIGGAAIITAVMAAVIWIAGPRLVAACAPADVKQAQTSHVANGSGEQAQPEPAAKTAEASHSTNTGNSD